MSKHEDEDGIDGPFNKAMDRAMREDARAAAKKKHPGSRPGLMWREAGTVSADDSHVMAAVTVNGLTAKFHLYGRAEFAVEIEGTMNKLRSRRLAQKIADLLAE